MIVPRVFKSRQRKRKNISIVLSSHKKPVIKPISGFFLFSKSLIKLLKTIKIRVRTALERRVFALNDRFLPGSNSLIMIFTQLLHSNDFQSHPHREESSPFPLPERTRFLIYSPNEHIYSPLY